MTGERRPLRTVREVWVIRSAGGYVGRNGQEGVPWHKARIFFHIGDAALYEGEIVPIFIEEPWY